MARPVLTAPPLHERLRVRVLSGPSTRRDLAVDVLRGFQSVPKGLPPKYFYDERGSQLFDAICHTPEYYLTRTERSLLESVADDVVSESRPTHLLELGSGAARKTTVLLRAIGRLVGDPWYVPVDISEDILVQSSLGLLAQYPRLRVHAIVADYEQHQHYLPREGRRMIAFLGSTLGNFRQSKAVRFLRQLASRMGADDRILLGLDLVKSPAILHEAYNDAAGVTAEFNLNLLRVINRELGATFEPSEFEHLARYLPEQQQIEMYLRTSRPQTVYVAALRRTFRFGAGEVLRTEISRKFTREGATRMIRGAGLELVRWLPSSDGFFVLLLARRCQD